MPRRELWGCEGSSWEGPVFYLGTSSCFTPPMFIDAIYRASVSTSGLFLKGVGKGNDILLCCLLSVSLKALATVRHDSMLHNPLIPATASVYRPLNTGAGNYLGPWEQRVCSSSHSQTPSCSVKIGLELHPSNIVKESNYWSRIVDTASSPSFLKKWGLLCRQVLLRENIDMSQKWVACLFIITSLYCDDWMTETYALNKVIV